MMHLRTIFSLGTLLAVAFSAGESHARPEFQTSQPTDYNGAISCSSCHVGATATEDNVGTSFGIAFSMTSVDHHNFATIVPAYRSLELIDSDGDGYNNIQEIIAGSSFNLAVSTPIFFDPYALNSGIISALPATGETINAASSFATTPAAVTALMGAGEKNVGGTVEYSMTNLGTNSAEFLFGTGGVQIGATAYFVDNAGNATAIPATIDGYGNIASIPTLTRPLGASASSKGSITLTIVDDGPFDLYSQAAFISTALARTPSFTPTAIFDIYAGVSPYANISPLAIIDPYAVIDAYAIVDDYATVGANATISSYAYVGPNVDVYSNVTIDPYMEVNSFMSPISANVTMPTPQQFSSEIQTRIAVTTTPPVARVYGNGSGAGTPSGGLHCMTEGLGSTSLMFLGLLAAAAVARRRKG